MPLFITSGRPMTGQLERAIDNLTGAHRRAAIRALQETDNSVMGPIYRALATELALAEMREDEALQAIAAASAEPDTDTRPWPQATGETMWHYPDSAA